jgi:hypothetical protein
MRTQKAPARISACVIACNEAECIGDCLASIVFCDEIVLVRTRTCDPPFDGGHPDLRPDTV